jgi:CHAT domain-containing protein
MERFYERYSREADAGRALALAQRTMLKDPATASPYFWAGFQLVGGH